MSVGLLWVCSLGLLNPTRIVTHGRHHSRIGTGTGAGIGSGLRADPCACAGSPGLSVQHRPDSGFGTKTPDSTRLQSKIGQPP